jgi:cytochrome b
MPNSDAANWAIAKRLVHWGIALAVVTALLAPKPEHGDGLLHIAAGTVALALVLVRSCWRAFGGVRPFFRDALRIKWPDVSKGGRGFAPFFLQLGRLIGFLFLAAIPLAVGLGVGGVTQGEESPLLEAHEVVGTLMIGLAIAHAAAIIVFAVLLKYDLIGVTITGGARSVGEGGARGWAGAALGTALGLGALLYVWGPLDIGAKAAALEEREQGGGEHEGGFRDED